MFATEIIKSLSYELLMNSFIIVVPWLLIYYFLRTRQILASGLIALIAINPVLTTFRVLNGYDVNIHIMLQFITLVVFSLVNLIK